MKSTKAHSLSQHFVFEHSLLLVFGSVAGLLWANLGHESYERFRHLAVLRNPYIGDSSHGGRVIDLHFVVSDLLMAFFFAFAGKEVWEATLPGGSLRDPRKAATPLIATVGGMVGPAALYLAGALAMGKIADYGDGWAIPCATDIAFSYMVARFVFGVAHPAVPFLLLLAIADDALGLGILAIFYPQQPIQPAWFLLPLAAVALGFGFRRARIKSFWWYLLFPGALSWVGFAMAGLHPALGLLPIIPTMPHAHTDLGIFMAGELDRDDTLNEFERWWAIPVEVSLGLFGLLNAGVVFGAVGEPTLLVLGGLLIGKPAGILLFGWLATRVFGFELPSGMNFRHLAVVGCAASIGFTVALFVSVVAFPPGAVQDAAKMGALLSFAGAGVTIAVAKALGVRKPAQSVPSA